MASTPEGKIKKKLDAMLKEFAPELWFYSPQSGIYGRSGVPDRIACYFGQLIGIECKRDGKHPATELQVATMKAMQKAGAMCVVVWDDTTINIVREYLIAVKTRERLTVNP